MAIETYAEADEPRMGADNTMRECAVTEGSSAPLTSRVLQLTNEEALGLLGMALVASCELTCPQQAALEKLGSLCREFARDSSQE